MKQLFPLIFLLCSCSQFHDNPFAFPEGVKLDCSSDICCYPYNKSTLVCVSGDALHSVVFYIKIVEK